MHQGDEEGETVGSKRLEALRHPIVVAFAGAFFGVLLGGISTWLTLRNASPVAKIIPLNPELKANESITFDARGSHDADGDRLGSKLINRFPRMIRH
jgi:hypothetical protein